MGQRVEEKEASEQKPVVTGTQTKTDELRDFPGGPVVKTRAFSCRGPGV